MNVGRPKVVVDAALVDCLRAQGLSYRFISRSLGLGLGTVYRAAGRRSKTVPKTVVESPGTATSAAHPDCAEHARFLAG